MKILIRMKIYFSLVILFFFNIAAYSQDESKKTVADLNFDFIWNAKQVSSTDIDQVLKNISDSITIEFTNIYPVAKGLPQNDSSVLVRKLKQLHFTQVNGGRGNWLKGPRMINYFLESDRFVCRVDKLYYDDATRPNHYIVTERIACLAKR